MATLNLSSNGPSINASYKKVVDSPLPSGAAASSATYGQWAVFTVQAPLMSAFQQDSGKESVLKVQTTGEGELVDLIDEFSDGRVQFGFVKVKDPNTGLPKNVLIAWCGEGVPERTKGYFNTHLAAVTKLLHGYHVQITARSDSDLTPEGIVQKVSDSSGAKYGGGSTPAPASSSSAAPPPIATKPVFMPTRSSATGGFNPLGSKPRAAAASASGPTDDDGWGQDAPQVTRSQLEKVAPAYKPTKVDMAELTGQKQEPSRFQPPSPPRNNGPSDVVKGGYQPIGKIDIAAIRRQAQEQGNTVDDRPAPVKGSYEPIGKVDIAAIRAKAGGPSAAAPAPIAAQQSGEQDAPPKSLAERSAAFSQSERITSLPKPKVANRFGSSASTFAGTKPPAPGGFEAKPLATSAPIGAADKNFAAQGGKTPAQLWAERKARERGMSASGDAAPPSSSGAPAPASPINAQQSGGWQSGYSGKKWGDVAVNRTGASNISAQRTGASNADAQNEEAHEESEVPSGGVSAIRDRFKNAAPMGAASGASEEHNDFASPHPPPMDLSSKPNAGAARGVPMPGLPQHPAASEAPEDYPEDEHVNIPPPPPQVPRSPSPEPDEDFAPSSPVRIVMPVARSAEPAPMAPAEEHEPPMPAASIAAAVESHTEAEPEPQIGAEDPARAASAAVAGPGAATADPGAAVNGKRALVQYDYEKAEDNEIELREGDYVTNIDMVDEDWWMGQNSRGETGLFPSNYVEIIEDDETGAGAGSAPPAPSQYEESEPAAPAAAGAAGKTAVAQYDYEATEDNELSFPDGATITNIEFPDEDWWLGEFNGKQGLFPANYVELNN
ncbi:hypothetical protein AAFC00_006195 [Neodothiora populina]|uniref:Actin binding protein n=1 Tax=Neodothiora populina TaxID=2781224 RepID=A0ABR3P4H9_9PEZI